MANINRNHKKPTKINEMSKEQIRQALVKKRECNSKAQKIVECLLETNVSESIFMNSLPEINQSHLEDIIQERSIIELCGYPLCSNKILQKDIPKQKYRISLKTNKVYDISERKSFCSNFCYQSALFVKKQMLTSPLWFREYEKVPKFQLLRAAPCAVGTLGQEVDITIVENIKSNKDMQFTSINNFAEASLNDIDSLAEQDCYKHVNTETKISDKDLLNQDRGIDKHKSEDDNKIKSENEILDFEKINLTNNQTSSKKIANNPFNIVGEIKEKPEKKIDPILAYDPPKEKPITKKQQKQLPPLAAITVQVETCLAEWFSIDTMLFLFGETKVKELVADKGDCIREYLNNYPSAIFYKSNCYDQYQALCRKLNMLELEDRRSGSDPSHKETKPLPDYSSLKEESKTIQIKVKTSFTGESKDNVKEDDNERDITDDDLTQIPLVDKNSQNALRRKIVCQHLNKVLPDLLRSLGLITFSISSDVKLLVNTFNLKANNIMFKPIQWTLIALIVIKLLSFRDKQLEHSLNQAMSFQHMQLLLLSFKQDGGYLDRLILWLTDIDRLIDTNDKQLTIE